MKSSIYVIVCVLLAAFALVSVAQIARAQDLMQVVPQDVKVHVDNDRVRVMEVKRSPGFIEPMHVHPAYVGYFVGPCKLKVTLPDGKFVEQERKAGEVIWSNGVTHAVENIGTTDLHILLIELKK